MEVRDKQGTLRRLHLIVKHWQQLSETSSCYLLSTPHLQQNKHSLFHEVVWTFKKQRRCFTEWRGSAFRNSQWPVIASTMYVPVSPQHRAAPRRERSPLYHYFYVALGNAIFHMKREQGMTPLPLITGGQDDSQHFDNKNKRRTRKREGR